MFRERKASWEIKCFSTVTLTQCMCSDIIHKGFLVRPIHHVIRVKLYIREIKNLKDQNPSTSTIDRMPLHEITEKIEDQLEIAVTPNTKVYKARNKFSTHTAHKCNAWWVLMREHPQSWLFFRDRTGQQIWTIFCKDFCFIFSFWLCCIQPAKIAFQNTGRVTLTMRVIKSQQLFS